MDSKTTFRKTLISELDEVANSREVDERLVQMEYVEEKQDVLGEFLDYYTDEPFKYIPFADEFDATEIGELRDFRDYLFTAMQTKTG